VRRPDDAEVADVLERIADLLAAQHANPYRVRAYRAAAEVLRSQRPGLAARLESGGVEALEALPAVGPSIAALVREYLERGRVTLLERLEGQVSPEDLFTTVPGIGEALAARVHRELGIETLEELEIAAHDGRLEQVTGFGPRRARGVREALAGILARSGRRRARRMRWLETRGVGPAGPEPGEPRPPVALLLAVDAEYRRRAEAGELRHVTPRRFNPDRRAWLPILHTEKEGWSFTALYSNTARAHELDKTRDWVVIYWERDGEEDQCTVVTETRGARAGQRVVRGREHELPPSE
jgi:hypothetical protein